MMKKLLRSNLFAGILLGVVILLVFLLAFFRRPVQCETWHGVVDTVTTVQTTE